MTIKFPSFALTATEVAAPLSATDLWCTDFSLQNIDATNEVFVGDSALTAAQGYMLLKTEHKDFSALIAPTNVGARRINLKDVYVICSAGETATLRINYTKEVL